MRAYFWILIFVCGYTAVVNFTTSLFTIGYEGLHSSQFFDILQAHDIQHLIDVRAVALSRKAGFSKTALRSACLEAGVEYSHLQALGCPKDIRNSYRTDGNWQEYTTRFLSYLATRESDVSELLYLAQMDRCALLCFEADANFCHRKYVAEAVGKISCQPIKLHHLSQNSIPTEEFLLALADR